YAQNHGTERQRDETRGIGGRCRQSQIKFKTVNAAGWEHGGRRLRLAVEGALHGDERRIEACGVKKTKRKNTGSGRNSIRFWGKALSLRAKLNSKAQCGWMVILKEKSQLTIP